MTSVSRKEGFRYGFYAFAYWLVLLVFSAALVAAGGWIVSEQVGGIGVNQEGGLAALGGFVAVLGVLVFGSGQIGLVYKVVADGVAAGAAGDRRAESAASDAEQAIPDGRAESPSGDSATGTATAGAASTEPDESPSGSATEDPDADAVVEGQPAARGAPPGSDGVEGHPELAAEPTPRPRERRSVSESDGQRGHDDREDTDDHSGTEPVTGAASGQRNDPAVPDPDEDSAGGDTAGRADAGPGGEQSAGRADATGSDEPSRSDPDDGADPAETGAARDSRAESGEQDPFSETDFDPPDGGEATIPAEDEDDGAAADTPSGGDEPDPESPADVASESGLAEELGFERTERPDEWRSTSADAASERTDSGVGDPTDGTTADDSDGATADADRATEDAASSASTTEAERAQTGADGDAGAGGDTEDDDSVPEWTTGENHVDEGDESGR